MRTLGDPKYFAERREIVDALVWGFRQHADALTATPVVRLEALRACMLAAFVDTEPELVDGQLAWLMTEIARWRGNGGLVDRLRCERELFGEVARD